MAQTMIIEQPTFLTNFPAKVRSLIANQFCYAVRSGHKQPDMVIRWVKADARKRLAKNPDQRDSQTLLLELLQEPTAALKFAAFIIHRESLPAEVREQQKEEQGKTFREQYMSSLPPTDKQLSYLRSLRCPTVPKTRLEASKLIEQFKR